MDEPLNIQLENMTVFYDIRLRLAAITQEMIDATERRLKPSKGKVIGTVENISTRALHTLHSNLFAEAQVAQAQTRLACHSEREEKDLAERAVLLDVLSDVCREMFWAQVKQDFGFYENESISLKSGWTVVLEKSGPPPELLGLLRGTFGGGSTE